MARDRLLMKERQAGHITKEEEEKEKEKAAAKKKEKATGNVASNVTKDTTKQKQEQQYKRVEEETAAFKQTGTREHDEKVAKDKETFNKQQEEKRAAYREENSDTLAATRAMSKKELRTSYWQTPEEYAKSLEGQGYSEEKKKQLVEDYTRSREDLLYGTKDTTREIEKETFAVSDISEGVLQDKSEEINTRVSSWMQNAQRMVADFTARYEQGNTTYREDAGEWLSKVWERRKVLQSDAETIKQQLDLYRNYLDPEQVSKITEAIDQGLADLDTIVSSSSADKKWWSQWESEEAYKQSDTYYSTLDIEAEEAALEELTRQLEEDNTENREAELKKQIEEKKFAISKAEQVQNRISLTQEAVTAEDFEENSQYVSTQKEFLGIPYYGDDTYEYINGSSEERQTMEARMLAGGGGSASLVEEGYKFMTEQEVKIYNYYYSKEGKDKAEEYLKSIAESLHIRKGQADFEMYEGNTAAELFYGIGAGLDQFGSGFKSLLNFKGEYVPPSATQVTSALIREDLADNGPEFFGSGNSLGQAGYDLITSASNALPSVLTSVALDMVAPGVGTAVGAVMAGASSAGNAYQEMLNLGYDQGQAATYGLLVGGSEAGLQYLVGGIGKLGGKVTGVSLQKAVAGIDNAFARVAIKLGGNAISEGIEEGVQDLLTTAFENIALNANNSWDDVEWSKVAYSAVLGAVSAEVMGGVGTVAEDVQTQKQGQQIQKIEGAVDALVAIGKSASPDSLAFDLASRVDENTGAYQIGTLMKEVHKSLSGTQLSQIKEGLMQRLVDEKSADKLTVAFGKFINEEANLTQQQATVMENCDPLTDTVKEVLELQKEEVVQNEEAAPTDEVQQAQDIVSSMNMHFSDKYQTTDVQEMVEKMTPAEKGEYKKALLEVATVLKEEAAKNGEIHSSSENIEEGHLDADDVATQESALPERSIEEKQLLLKKAREEADLAEVEGKAAGADVAAEETVDVSAQTDGAVETAVDSEENLKKAADLQSEKFVYKTLDRLKIDKPAKKRKDALNEQTVESQDVMSENGETLDGKSEGEYNKNILDAQITSSRKGTPLGDSDRISLKEETGWSDEVVNAIYSIEEAEVYKKANLVEKVINGIVCLVRGDIDWDQKDSKGKTNRELAEMGKAPYTKSGEKVELHHMAQKNNGVLVELTSSEHRGKDNSSYLHNPTKKSEINRSTFGRKVRHPHWKSRGSE